MTKIIVLHPPKTGGTALKSTLVKDYTVHKAPLMESIIPGVYFGNHNIRINKEDQFIVFLRDPVKRIKSYFMYKKYHQFYDTHEIYKPSYSEWVNLGINEFVESIEEWNIKGISWYLKWPKDYRKNVYFVGHTETLEKDFTRLMQKLGYEYKLSQKMTNKRPKHINEVLTERSKKIIKDFYCDDYELINYINDLE